MFNNHKLTLIHKLDQIGYQLYDNNTVIIAISSEPFPNQSNIYDGGILMPPTQVLMNWADGNGYSMNTEYPSYLQQQGPDEFIVGILTALTAKNVFIYIPIDEYKIYGNILLGHLLYMYGIRVETPVATFAIDVSKIPFISAKMYQMGVMSGIDFLKSYPTYGPLPHFVIQKLVAEFGIQGPDIIGELQRLRESYHNPVSKDMVSVVK